MKVRVELHGSLANLVPETSRQNRVIEIDVSDSARIRDLADLLNIPLKKIGPVATNGKIVKLSDPVPANARIKFYQSVAGG